VKQTLVSNSGQLLDLLGDTRLRLYWGRGGVRRQRNPISDHLVNALDILLRHSGKADPVTGGTDANLPEGHTVLVLDGGDESACEIESTLWPPISRVKNPTRLSVEEDGRSSLIPRVSCTQELTF
jgi:hypothetical protein